MSDPFDSNVLWQRLFWFPLSWAAASTSSASSTSAPAIPAPHFPSSNPAAYSVVLVALLWTALLIVNFTLPCWRSLPQWRDVMFRINAAIRTLLEGWLLAHVIIAAGVAFGEEESKSTTRTATSINITTISAQPAFTTSADNAIVIARLACGVVCSLAAILFGLDRDIFAFLSNFTFAFWWSSVVAVFVVDGMAHLIQKPESLSSLSEFIEPARGSPALLFAALAIGVATAVGRSSSVSHGSATMLSAATLMAGTTIYWFCGLMSVAFGSSASSSSSWFPLPWFVIPAVCFGATILFLLLLHFFVSDSSREDLRRHKLRRALAFKRELLEHLVGIVDASVAPDDNDDDMSGPRSPSSSTANSPIQLNSPLLAPTAAAAAASPAQSVPNSRQQQLVSTPPQPQLSPRQADDVDDDDDEEDPR